MAPGVAEVHAKVFLPPTEICIGRPLASRINKYLQTYCTSWISSSGKRDGVSWTVAGGGDPKEWSTCNLKDFICDVCGGESRRGVDRGVCRSFFCVVKVLDRIVFDFCVVAESLATDAFRLPLRLLLLVLICFSAYG